MTYKPLRPSPFDVLYSAVRKRDAASPAVTIRGPGEPDLLPLWVRVVRRRGNNHEAASYALLLFIHEPEDLAGGGNKERRQLNLDERIGARILHAKLSSWIGVAIHPAVQRVTPRSEQLGVLCHSRSVARTVKDTRSAEVFEQDTVLQIARGGV